MGPSPRRAGDVLFREGDRDYDFFVVLAGKVAIVENHGRHERVISVHGPGRFLGEVSMLTGQAALVTAVMREPGEVLVVPVRRLRARILHDSTLGDLILRAFLIRVRYSSDSAPVCGSSAHATRRTPGGCGSSPPATGSRTGGSISRRTARPRRCCVSWACPPSRRPW
jgi:CRP-like cAMP-binding protein